MGGDRMVWIQGPAPCSGPGTGHLPLRQWSLAETSLLSPRPCHGHAAPSPAITPSPASLQPYLSCRLDPLPDTEVDQHPAGQQTQGHLPVEGPWHLQPPGEPQDFVPGGGRAHEGCASRGLSDYSPPCRSRVQPGPPGHLGPKQACGLEVLPCVSLKPRSPWPEAVGLVAGPHGTLSMHSGDCPSPAGRHSGATMPGTETR